MFSHVYVGTNDFARAVAFYTPIMEILGNRLRFSDPQKPWAGWQPRNGGRPLFLLGTPFDGEPAQSGNGQMIAFLAPDRASVDSIHALALASGGRCEGPPGLRPHYHAHYYGAYFRDPDGNKICVCNHDAPALPA
ncbi:VOC family protein [uncultured Phyllobacterium sp.]|uniref:VOC family protein n=1 Tax=uncultured Phyllobacterium sp. TaxID=253813 RepID=UPI002590E9FE|nr:VOC family protein [uncultured Phyllobacterium sp.]